MKYRLLLTGTNRLLMNEFFNHMDFNFECMSSTERSDDLLCHIKYFKPELIVYCLQNESKHNLEGFRGIIQRIEDEDITLVIVGEQEVCSLFNRSLPMKADLTVTRPFTTKSLEETIVVHMESLARKKKRKRQEEEEQKQKLEKLAASLSDSQEIEDTLTKIDNMANALAEKEQVKKRILVVDDDSSVLKLMKGYLGNRYQVATALNGKVAMKYLEKKEVDLILLDYEMPEENGEEVFRRIKATEKVRNIPVVFLTGVTDRERIQGVLALKPQGYLLKPIDTERLSAKLEEIFGK